MRSLQVHLAAVVLLALVVSVPAAAPECPAYPEAIKAIVYQQMKARTLVRDA